MIDKTFKPMLGDNSPNARLIYGRDVKESLRALPEGSVHCVVTSPPYWSLRTYLPENAEGKNLEIGSEQTVGQFIENLVDVFRELRRVLRKDGTVWLNLGGSYAGGGRAGKNADYHVKHTSFGKLDYVASNGGVGKPVKVPDGLKPKDMVGEPWRVAFALQQDGWYLRAACPWIKRNCLPESCTDRPSSSIEYVFLLAHPDSNGKYYYDVHGSRKSAVSAEEATRQLRSSDFFMDSLRDILAGEQGLLSNDAGDPLALVVNPKPYAGAHFACFPERLVEPCLLSSNSAYGTCGTCGAPYVRTVVRSGGSSAATGKAQTKRDIGLNTQFNGYDDGSDVAHDRTSGWNVTCVCDRSVPVSRSVVMDIFSGSATTGAVAIRLGYNYIGLDLNDQYLPLAEARLRGDSAPSGSVQPDEGSALDIFGAG